MHESKPLDSSRAASRFKARGLIIFPTATAAVNGRTVMDVPQQHSLSVCFTLVQHMCFTLVQHEQGQAPWRTCIH